jgi:hypothetical protein
MKEPLVRDVSHFRSLDRVQVVAALAECLHIIPLG